MRQFTDADGATWPLRINAAAMARIRDQAGVDFVDSQQSGNIWDAALADPVTLSLILAAACEPTATDRGVSLAAFTESLGGAELREAATVLALEIIDFFLEWSPPVGRLLQTSYRAHQRYMSQADIMVQEKLRRLETDVEKMVEQATKEASLEVDRQLEELERPPTTGS